MSQFGDGVSGGIIVCTLRDFATMQMGNRNTQEVGCLGRCHGFKTVAQNHQNIWFHGGQCLRYFNDPTTNSLSNVQGLVASQLKVNTLVDAKAIFLDVTPSVAVLG